MEAIEERIYSQVGGWLCLDFTNTGASYTPDKPEIDAFQSYSDLTTWARQAEIITPDEEQALNRKAEGAPQKAHKLLEQARQLRSAINRVFSAVAVERQPDSKAIGALNRHLAQAMAHARIENAEDGFQWGWDAFPNTLESLLWPVVRSAADLLVNHEKLERVRQCADDTCGWLFVDTSKNHSRRWCDMRDCGNTAKARRHYHRKVAEAQK